MKLDTKSAIDRYVASGIPPGGFLLAVLQNDLKEAFARADEGNTRDMFEIVSYCYNNIPSVAWGSPAAVLAWLARERVSA